MAEDIRSTLTNLLVFVVKKAEKLLFRPSRKFFTSNRM
jgi:hypothetical protein